MKIVCEWMVDGTDNNILSALLSEGEDNLCVVYMGHYNRFLKKELLLQAL